MSITITLLSTEQMGVKGLKTFIENNDDLLVREHKLHDISVVIDAYNLIGNLLRRSQKSKRRDLSEKDLEQFTSCVNSIFDTFQQCNIDQLLVFDGEQTSRPQTKFNEHAKKAQAAKRKTISVIKTRFGVFVPPVAATDRFRSIAMERGIKIVQCMNEADVEIARISRALDSPVISNDSDFYLIDLPHGLIPIDLIEYQQVKKSSLPFSNLNNRNNNATPEDTDDHYCYINCSIFYQDHFIQYFPNLSKSTLPLLGVLAGNDLVQSKVIEKICSQLPLARISEQCGLTTKQFRNLNNKQQEKIIKILYYMCDKTLEENVNKICQHVARENRRDLKDLIKSNMKVYIIPFENESEIELRLQALSG